MVQGTWSPCSPYLLKHRRDLADACRQICKAHGQATPPCGACALNDVCRRWPRANPIAVSRPKRSPTNDSGAVRAAA